MVYCCGIVLRYSFFVQCCKKITQFCEIAPHIYVVPNLDGGRSGISLLREMSSWIHCNVCIRLPSSANDVHYLLSTCKHILCSRCLSAVDEGICPCCKQKAKFVIINRELRPEIQRFFKDPKDILVQYAQSLSDIMQFQNSQRAHLDKAVRERQKRALKFMRSCQLELKNRFESERKAIAEKESLLKSMDKLRRHCQMLESALSARNNQADHYITTPSSFKSDKQEHRTPSSSSFKLTKTSTPVENDGVSPSQRLATIFGESGNEPSPITTNFLTTPEILGMGKKGIESKGMFVNLSQCRSRSSDVRMLTDFHF
ncbi:hypothetical protein AB6A40_002002 [Gnathostoma spinigerum]|uniref:RING-type domain-containing protein n=1 Tax=Gnathostoma spinigerum TaxID=75299 RepID=A0ABD6E5J1_9BILA